MLKAQIQEAMKAAMREKNQPRLDAIRLILAAVKQIEVDERIEVDDTRMLSILNKLLKQRRDSIEQYQAAHRQDLVDKENFEVQIIQSFMPAQLSDAEIEVEIKQAMAETHASGIQEMGKIMGILKEKLAGRAEMGKVGKLVKDALQG